LAACGFESRLCTIAEDPCLPDVIGVNHYLSSERLLDHRIERHGGRAHADRALGKTDGIMHVDVDAVRNLPDEVIGLAGLVEQAWERYGIPVAITECHLGSTREEQARWFIEAWRESERLRRRGVDLRAVTAWSLLGAYDWNSMVTRFVGHYESGVFDVRNDTPRPTLMVQVLKDLVNGKRPSGPGLDLPGWWRERRESNGRFLVSSRKCNVVPASSVLAIIGDEGTLTTLAVDACEARGLHYTMADQVALKCQIVQPWAVLNTRKDGVSHESDLNSFCAGLGVNGAFFSEIALDDRLAKPWLLAVEHDTVFTVNDDAALPVRLLDALDADQPISVPSNLHWTGVYGPSLIDSVLDLLLDGVTGTVRFAEVDRWSHAQLFRALADVTGNDRAPGEGINDVISSPERGPTNSNLPPVETVLERFVADRRRLQERTLGSHCPQTREF